jgi:lipopolysaccharide biosynthesis glycosyltransferase
VCNDKYLPGLEALILSLKQQYPGLFNRYVVYHDGNLSNFSQQRLTDLYPYFEFIQADPQQFQVRMGNAENHKRVGLLGYLSIHALALQGPGHVIVLDADLLVLGDISPLWHGDQIQAAPDIGVRPYGIVSAESGRPVLNSGVLSLPPQERGPGAVARAALVLRGLDRNIDVDIAGFADQRFWNVFLADREVKLLPHNFNAIKSLVATFCPDHLSDVSILHFTGAKPWYAFLHKELLAEGEQASYRDAESSFRTEFALWRNRYIPALLRERTRQFHRDCASDHEGLRGSALGRPTVLIGNGPSLSRTNLNDFRGYEKIAFNWFVHHDDFDDVRVDHLVLASHMLFGGWQTPNPQLPESFLSALLARQHRPRLWASYTFKPYLEQLAELKDYSISYFFFEKPFKRSISDTGHPEFDLRHPLVDANTGVLTAGVPIALHLGCRDIVLTGCDSNYRSTAGSYFYPESEHSSKTTKKPTLLKTWAKGGAGHYGYEVTHKALRERGIAFYDATRNGNLTSLPKISSKKARSLAKKDPRQLESLEGVVQPFARASAPPSRVDPSEQRSNLSVRSSAK